MEKQLDFEFQGYRATCRLCHVLVFWSERVVWTGLAKGGHSSCMLSVPLGNLAPRSVFLLRTCV